MPESLAPLISIVMPTYNRAAYIGETIESIQKQSWTNWELIIEDDGSVDDTEGVIHRINDKRIKFYKQEHAGMPQMRNKGLEKAKGDLIAFMDSDDLWAPDKLKKQLTAFEENPDAGFCLTGGYDFREKGEALGYFYQQKEGSRYGDFFIPFFESKIAALSPTLLFKKICLKTTGPLRPVGLCDVEFVLSLCRHFKGIVLYEPLFFRRLHHSNNSALTSNLSHFEGIQMIKSYKHILPKKIFRNALFKSHLRFGEECLGYSEKRKALCQFLRAWKTKPLSLAPFKKIGKTFLRPS